MLNMYPITSIIRITIKVSCSIASPPNKIRGQTPSNFESVNRLPLRYALFQENYSTLCQILQQKTASKGGFNIYNYLKYLASKPSNAFP